MGHKRKKHSSSGSSSKRQEVEASSHSDSNPFEAVVEDSVGPEEENEEGDEDIIPVDVPPDESVDDEDMPELLSPENVEEVEVPKVKAKPTKAPMVKKKPVIELPHEDIDMDLARQALTCPICTNQFRYPVVNCDHCQNYPMCHECFESIALAKNGNTEKTPCPLCRSTKGFSESRVHNGLIGQKRVPCKNQPKGCLEKPSQDQHETHLNKYCLFGIVVCRNSKFGCPWRDFRIKLAAHEDLCECEKKAERSKKRDEAFKLLNEKIQEAQRVAETTIARVEVAVLRGVLAIRAETEQLYVQQKTLSMFKPIYSFTKLRKPDSVAVVLHNSTNRPITMTVEITVDAKKFFTLTAFTNAPQLRYPLVVAGYVLPQDTSIKEGSAGVVHFALKFWADDRKFSIFRETDVLSSTTEEEQEQILESRDPLIKFAIIGSVLWPNEKRT